MSGNRIRGYGMLAVLLAVFSVVAFAIPFEKNTVFWIGYGCGVFAILFQLVIFRISFRQEDARSRFYGFPVARLGIGYLVLQLVLSVAEIALARFLPAWVALILNALLLGLALIGCVTADTMREEILRQDRALKKDVSVMRDLQSRAAALVSQCADEKAVRSLRKLADEFRYSDPVTSEATRELEAELRSRLQDLQQAIVDGNAETVATLADQLTEKLRERNRVCAVHKA